MNLAALQREMAAAVMMPLTAGEDMQEVAPDGRMMASVAGQFIAPNSRLSAFERLEIYNRQYWYRVLGALAEDFPALKAVVGAARFEALSVAYLSAHPSRSFTMRNLGCKLVEWLLAHPEFAGRRHRLAVDVARVEWAFVEAFDSADRTPLTLDQVATLDGGSRLSLQPHLQLVELGHEADDLVLALHNREKRGSSEAGVKHEESGEEAARVPEMKRKPTWLAVHRVELSVFYRRLQKEEFQTLAALRAGLNLGAALEAGWSGSRVAAGRRMHLVREWFANWAELGWICAPDLEELI